MVLTTATVAALYLPAVGTLMKPADRSASCNRTTALPCSPFFRCGVVPCDSKARDARRPPTASGSRPMDLRNLANSRASAAEKRPLTVAAKPALVSRHSIALAWAPVEPCLSRDPTDPVASCQLARFVGVVDLSEDARLTGVLLILVLDR